MQKIITATLIATALISGNAIAADAKAAPAKSEKAMPGAMAADVTRTEATVLVIELATRTLTLRDETGRIFDITVGPEARNLDQVKQGDIVVAEYSQAVAIALKKGSGKADTVVKTDVQRTPKGAKPGAVITREVDFVANVIAIDTKASVVTVQGAAGKIVDIKVKDPKVLAQVKVGDQVEGAYVEAMAIAVLPKQKK